MEIKSTVTDCGKLGKEEKHMFMACSWSCIKFKSY